MMMTNGTSSILWNLTTCLFGLAVLGLKNSDYKMQLMKLRYLKTELELQVGI